MIISTVCFFLTALLEYFIKIDYVSTNIETGIWSIIKSDFSLSMRFIAKERPYILKLLLLFAVINFFTAGISTVGMPFMIRNILGLDAIYYGAAESALGIAAIAGSIAAGLLVSKLKTNKLYWFIAVLGVSFLPTGVFFLFNAPTGVSYASIISSFVLAQFVACIFSIFALSVIQQRTPNELLGKVMAYISTVSMCAQPLGQMVYGTMFDLLSNRVFLILIPTSIILYLIGIASKKMFVHFEK